MTRVAQVRTRIASAIFVFAVGCGGNASETPAQNDSGSDVSTQDSDASPSDTALPWQEGNARATVVWSKTIRCDSGIVAHSVGRMVVGTSGDLEFGGGLSGTCSLFGATKRATLGYDAFAVRLAATDGANAWTRFFGDASFQNAHRSFGLALAGVAAGTVDFGDGVTLSSPPAGSPAAPTFVASLSEAGKASFARVVGESLSALTVAPDGIGGIVVGASAAGNVDYGSGPISVPLNQAIVARFDASGAPLFVRKVTTSGFDTVRIAAVSIAKDERSIVLGFVKGAAIFEGSTETLSAPAGASFVARLGSKGEYLGGSVLPTTCELDSLSVSGTHVVASGRCPGLEIQALDSDGAVGFRRSLGAESGETFVTTTGDVWIAGRFRGELAFGDVKLASAGASDAFIGRLDPDGTPRTAIRFGDIWDQGLEHIVVAGVDKDLFVSGSALAPPDSPGFDVVTVTRLTIGK